MTVVDDLRVVLPADAVISDRDVLGSYRRDRAGLTEAGDPACVVLPRDAEEVATVVRIAAESGTPVVPRGAGSGLSGAANAIDGCIIVSLMRMDRIVEIDPDNLLAVVEPGVLNSALAAAVAAHGLWYPPDPASREFSTIGGNLATNAGGLCCVKYGVTGDFVLGLEVVLADARVARFGRRTVKGVAGYDVVALFVGSEGTLGIITQATLRLRPRRPPPATLVATFGALASCGDAIARIMRRTVPALLEVLDRTTIQAIDEWKRMGFGPDTGALLVAQSDVAGAEAGEELETIERCCRGAGAVFVARSSDRDEADELMAARRFAYEALERQGATLLDDVAVPPARVPDLLAGIEQISAARGVVIGTFGHAGDGNMHPTIVFDRDDVSGVAAARAAFDDIVELALRLGGTVTGEHGVGVLKRAHLARELGQTGVDVHGWVKDAFDPGSILNPGKVTVERRGPRPPVRLHQGGDA